MTVNGALEVAGKIGKWVGSILRNPQPPTPLGLPANTNYHAGVAAYGRSHRPQLAYAVFERRRPLTKIES
jgi:hypothetical protein